MVHRRHGEEGSGRCKTQVTPHEAQRRWISRGVSFIFVELLESIDVGHILRTTGRLLVLDEVPAGDHADGLAPVVRRYAVGPRLLEIDAVYRRDDVDSHGLDSNLEHRARRGQVVDAEIVEGRTEGRKGAVGAFRIVRRRMDPHPEILRRARVTMSRERMGADHEVLSARRVQRGQQISEVGVRLH